MDLKKRAIKSCLEGDWEKAIEYNSLLIKENPRDINALNRLARSWANLGKPEKAKPYYEQVLKLDKYNPIALKNLQNLKRQKAKKQSNSPLAEDLFIKEPGKTKSVKLARVASAGTLLSLDTGQKVNLTPKNKLISITDEENNYLGAIPDNLSRYLIALIKSGNEYEAFVKYVDKKNLEIFIREVKRSKKYQNKPSFPATGIPYQSYLAPESVYKDTPDVSPIEEDEPAKKKKDAE